MAMLALRWAIMAASDACVVCVCGVRTGSVGAKCEKVTGISYLSIEVRAYLVRALYRYAADMVLLSLLHYADTNAAFGELHTRSSIIKHVLFKS